MDTDLALILGLVIGGLSIPSIMSAISDRRSPRASALTILIACGLLYYATATKPGGYQIDQIPNVFFSVLGRYF
ncbi:hypothetical protein FEE96_01680 [Parasedimentitalea maritima]|uniref:50S ribosomal protein L35 n=1 Tax=Parasedimentitalea maritima TaxID=2578117 RepID=A0A5R8ZRN3_9RHOB|nr:hypothetical protein [Zongyanglinia marina]KAE9632514.1 hypothetical protein GP644_01700 [Zongyanglinia marina]TLP69022.1 hypothetical protein FEE96_01680 [Zongyanglinia marina]